MKYGILVTTQETITKMLGVSKRTIQTYVFPENLSDDTKPVVCVSHDGLKFSAICLR